MIKGIDLIRIERNRQIEVEGWDDVHDSDHDAMQMSAAAGCYLANALSKFDIENSHMNEDGKNNFRFQVRDLSNSRKWVDAWPWDKEWDKRKKHDIKRSLEIAGALIAAELDRILEEELYSE